MPLNVVEPSRFTNSLRLLSVGTQGKTEAERAGVASGGYHRPQMASSGQLTLSIAAIGEVLALHYLLHNVICINASIVHPGWVALH